MARKVIRKWFDSMDSFEDWNSNIEDCDEVVSIVNESGWLRIDLTTTCKHSSTALRRFFGQLVDVKEAYDWKESMEEHAAYSKELAKKSEYYDGSCHANDTTMADGTDNPYPSYSYGVEMLDNGWWYVFLNVITDEKRKEYEAEQEAEAKAEAEAEKRKALNHLGRAIRCIECTEVGWKSAWKKGVKQYAIELVETVQEAIEGGWYDPSDLDAPKVLRKIMLNGATDWKEYSWGGSSLIYDGDIAERLCSPSELKNTRNGERRPNAVEQWLDVQARALYQASELAAKAIEIGRQGW